MKKGSNMNEKPSKMIEIRPCFECEKPSEHDHHVVPRVFGGTKTVPLCKECHGKAHGLHGRFSEMVKAGIRNSSKATGRPRKINHDRILEMRGRGKSHTVIARTLGCSKGSVQYALSKNSANAE